MHPYLNSKQGRYTVTVYLPCFLPLVCIAIHVQKSSHAGSLLAYFLVKSIKDGFLFLYLDIELYLAYKFYI